MSIIMHMKTFHISDILSITTGRLVSNRHMDGVYDVLNFLTGDDIYTHQIPRVMDEVKACMRAQYPQLMEDRPDIFRRSQELTRLCQFAERDRSKLDEIIARWVEEIRIQYGLDARLPLRPLREGEHTHIHPYDEARSMGKEVIEIRVPIDSEPEPKP